MHLCHRIENTIDSLPKQRHERDPCTTFYSVSSGPVVITPEVLLPRLDRDPSNHVIEMKGKKISRRPLLVCGTRGSFPTPRPNRVTLCQKTSGRRDRRHRRRGCRRLWLSSWTYENDESRQKGTVKGRTRWKRSLGREEGGRIESQEGCCLHPA